LLGVGPNWVIPGWSAGRWRPRSWPWCRAGCPARWSGDGLGWWSA